MIEHTQCHRLRVKIFAFALTKFCIVLQKLVYTSWVTLSVFSPRPVLSVELYTPWAWAGGGSGIAAALGIASSGVTLSFSLGDWLWDCGCLFLGLAGVPAGVAAPLPRLGRLFLRAFF